MAIERVGCRGGRGNQEGIDATSPTIALQQSHDGTSNKRLKLQVHSR